MVRRDYIEWLIAEVVQALEKVAGLVRAGNFDGALLVLERTSDAVLGPFAEALRRIDAESAVLLLGPADLDRLRLYAAIKFEEGAVHERRGRPDAARACWRRAGEIYVSAASAGVKLEAADQERLRALDDMRDRIGLDGRHRLELHRLVTRS